MKIKTTQAGSTTEGMFDEDKKKELEASASTIEVPITNDDKTNLSELRPNELKKIALNAKTVNLLHNAMCMEERGDSILKGEKKNKKSLALVAAKDEKMIEMDDSNNEEDDIAMLAKNFKKILKYKNSNGDYPQRSRYKNYKKRASLKNTGTPKRSTQVL
ncbi:hypothetical protein LIER_07485 [Lithospermum erythrorhizon]|uniref:Uncharacterized protein n=1 Tax=Lithospermum erythrorhizon TaxID=34254 RepID=A0AAV3PAB2_LITER